MRRTALVFIFLLIIVFLLVLVINQSENRDPKQSDVKITYGPPPSQDKIIQFTIEADETGQSAPTVKSENRVTDSTPVETTYHQAERCLLIQDAIGQGIQHGKISLATEAYDFWEGRFGLPVLLGGEILVTVKAEGYFSTSYPINFDQQSFEPIILEYKSAFTILVLNHNGLPCGNAAVRLMKVSSPIRPTIVESSIATSRGYLPSINVVNRKEGDCVVASANRLIHKNNTVILPYGQTKPKLGDQLISVGNCSWNSSISPFYFTQKIAWFNYVYFPIITEKSSMLRMWDTLTYSKASAEGYCCTAKEYCEIRRNGERGFYFLSFPDCMPNPSIVKEAKTNVKGECQFIDLYPALYYVQAFNGNSHSDLVPLHPSCSGTQLTLVDSSEVFVRVKRSGIKSNNQAYHVVEDIPVILKSLEGKGIFSTNTDFDGFSCFQNVPFGDYELVVSTPNEIVNEKVIIDTLEEKFTIQLKSWERYTVSGTVIDKETNLPVTGFELSLCYEARFEMKGEHSTTISDSVGRFMFEDVIPGTYSIGGKIPANTDKMSSLETIQYLSKFESSMLESFLMASDTYGSRKQIAVSNDNIENLVIPVEKVIQTHLAGKVIYKNGIPAEEIPITITAKYPTRMQASSFLATVPNEPKTDTKGHFEFTIISDTFQTDKPIELRLTATKGQIIPSYWEQKEDDSYEFIESKTIPYFLGSTNVSGFPGDTFDDIVIVLSAVENKIIGGKLLSEENDYSQLTIYAYQNNQNLPIQINSMGEFNIHNVESGIVNILLHPRYYTFIDTSFGKQRSIKYILQNILINVPENEQYVNADISLSPAGYFWGVVLNAQAQPVPGVLVILRRYSDNKRIYSDFTSEDGFYFINEHNVNMDDVYYLSCYYTNNFDNPVCRSSPMKPNQENIQLVIH